MISISYPGNESGENWILSWLVCMEDLDCATREVITIGYLYRGSGRAAENNGRRIVCSFISSQKPILKAVKRKLG
jgi:hypothetical protein